MTDDTDNDRRLQRQWFRWCIDAANMAGISYAELLQRLEDGDAALQITFTIKPKPGDPPKV